jgi:hypothetical protein
MSAPFKMSAGLLAEPDSIMRETARFAQTLSGVKSLRNAHSVMVATIVRSVSAGVCEGD